MSMQQFSRELTALLNKHEVDYFVAQGVNEDGNAVVIAKGNNPGKLLFLSMDLTKEIIDKIKEDKREEQREEEEEEQEQAMKMEARFQSSNKADIQELLGQILSTLGK